ncbi:MAG TPA: DUF5668 domain-containing protein [Candidatus Polarisedimenticolia bacterium]|nr:DUF5668 domain-containing protein [Candidatus Polarisedimenticolia bacterium]
METREGTMNEIPPATSARHRIEEEPRAAASIAPPSFRFDPRAKSPALACFLSVMPGLGQIYVGYYQRGFVHVLVVGSVIALLADGAVPALIPLMGIFLAFFWLYNVIDAGRRAALYNLALSGAGSIKLPDEMDLPGMGGSLIGGICLIAFGVILLAHTRFDMSLAWVKEWWPMAPILFGAYLAYKGATSRQQER